MRRPADKGAGVISRVVSGRAVGTSKRTVDRWQDRFITHGLAGLQRDATRRGRKPLAAPQESAEATLLDRPHPGGSRPAISKISASRRPPKKSRAAPKKTRRK